IFDGGLEAYRTVTEEEYSSLLTTGLIVLDANVLLNLYRYHVQTRNDLLAVLARLEDRLWIPRHVMREFFENRLFVISSRDKEIDKVLSHLEKNHHALEHVIRAWAIRLGLPAEQTAEITGPLRPAVEEVAKHIRSLSSSESFKQAADTTKDPVITALSP